MNKYSIKQPALASLLTLALILSFAGGLTAGPGAVAAQGQLGLELGTYRGLSQSVSIPIYVVHATDLVSLEFTVVANGNDDNIEVSVASVARGADLPGDAQLTYSGIGSNRVSIGFYMQSGSINGNGELVVINFTHNGTESVDGKKINLTIPTTISATGGAEFGSPLDLSHITAPITGEITVDIMYGDLNRDNSITIQDAFIALRAAVGNITLNQQLKRAGNVQRNPIDKDNPGLVTVYDALLIARYVVGLIDYFPVNPPTNAPPPPIAYTGPGAAVASIAIGNQPLAQSGDPTVIGGPVTFKVKFNKTITGQGNFVEAKLDNNIIGSVSIDGTDEVNITANISSVSPGYYWVEFYHLNSTTQQRGLWANRYVEVVAPGNANALGFKIDSFPNPTQITFDWTEPAAATSVRVQQNDLSTTGPGPGWPNSTVTAGKTVINLQPDRGYEFRLKVDGGVHDGVTNSLTVHRMANGHANKNGNDLEIFVRYTGNFSDSANLNTLIGSSFELGSANTSPNIIAANGADGIKLTFTDYYLGSPATGDTNLRYVGDITGFDALDKGTDRHLVSEDSITVTVPQP